MPQRRCNGEQKIRIKRLVKEHYSCIQNVVAILHEKETIITYYTLQYLKLLNNATKTMSWGAKDYDYLMILSKKKKTLK